MYDDDGKKTWSAELDIYGRVRTFDGRSLNSCPFRYQGQYEDSETGLYYNRFRYYDPSTGAYLSQDPIGLAGGNPTIYGYVKDVNNRLDILGLDGTTFYHAGDISGSIDPSKGRTNLDFNPSGKGGFYVTEDLAQAQEWASRKGVGITQFDIPNDELAKLNIKNFDAPDGEWADFVTKGRKGTLSHGFDGVSGPMLANPKATMSGAKPKAKGTQLAIFSDKAAKLFDKHNKGKVGHH
jgi:RHS repeat-associated protein